MNTYKIGIYIPTYIYIDKCRIDINNAMNALTQAYEDHIQYSQI